MRSLERKFGAICRAVAVKVAEGRRGAATDVSAAERPPQQGGKSPGGGFLCSVCVSAGRTRGSNSWLAERTCDLLCVLSSKKRKRINVNTVQLIQLTTDCFCIKKGQKNPR